MEEIINSHIFSWPIYWKKQNSLNWHCCYSKISICFFPGEYIGMSLLQLISLHGISQKYKIYCEQSLRQYCKSDRKKLRFLRNKLNWLIQFSLRCARAVSVCEKCMNAIISVDFMQSSQFTDKHISHRHDWLIYSRLHSACLPLESSYRC